MNSATEKHSLPKVVDDCHRLLRWLIPTLDKFPRNRRYTLGEKIESGLLDVLGICVSAAHSRNKHSMLIQASTPTRWPGFHHLRLMKVCQRVPMLRGPECKVAWIRIVQATKLGGGGSRRGRNSHHHSLLCPQPQWERSVDGD